MKNKRFVQDFQCTILTDIGRILLYFEGSMQCFFYKVAYKYTVEANTRITSHKT